MMLPPRKRRPGDPDPRRGRLSNVRVWIGLLAGVFVLNFALTFHNVWPTPWITTRNELSVEIAALMLGLILYSYRVRIPSKRTMTVLALVLLVGAIGRYAEVTAPALYGRRVNLYWDAPHLLNVAAMLRTAASPATIVLAAVSASALLVAVFALLRWSLLQVRNALDFALPRAVLGTAAAGLVVFYLAGYTAIARTLYLYSIPITATYWQQARFTYAAYAQARNPQTDLCARTPTDYDLNALADADVLVMFAESYGAVAYDRAEIAANIEPARGALAAAVAETGRHVASAFVTSPTFGGASWLAHSTLLTGQTVGDNGTYNLLLTQECDTLTKVFARNGYRVVGLMPGLKLEWPEGAFYDFDRIYGEPALEYRGPEFGWWRVPDQYALAKLEREELAPDSRSPVFAFFTTISSHMPFRPTPPYQGDWERILGAEAFDAAVVDASLAVEPDWTNLAPDYAATIAYTLEYVAGFLRERAPDDIVLVLLGDHQPPASVTGEGARWDVPVHVVSNKPELLARLVDAGFEPGLVPGAEPIGDMRILTPLIFDGSR
jgi:hypothetical protein